MKNEHEFKNVTAYCYIGRAECLVLKSSSISPSWFYQQVFGNSWRSFPDCLENSSLILVFCFLGGGGKCVFIHINVTIKNGIKNLHTLIIFKSESWAERIWICFIKNSVEICWLDSNYALQRRDRNQRPRYGSIAPTPSFLHPSAKCEGAAEVASKRFPAIWLSDRQVSL